MNPENKISLRSELSEDREKDPEKASDMEFAFFILQHIKNPCEIAIESGVKEHIRDFYIRLAKEEIIKMKNPDAIKVLEDEIKKY
ncbi:MAG: hypothetical protein A3A98_02595 [Candidatus Staskawiczbacteria bacterium RIFCSPLOWO2_01_FULL_40_39]|uniref:Uncharacterized protein n=1 Tax=Candidatus Staskawiczbacteria bacterium RIFCSPHIGHO2_01_FULL_39_25 TaxID=1802202 RepID=A0A1G2HP28_9BACT|nr:MAG: hypothetical protein A2730_02320 [Candidatus Staskawiczbacteria bacterium RIFCSPHIGHO2_01_FULL_39_25]OGZ73638.1 MAG: hypothetical protein A3A98_02595 [Candidatus Staskawiczbacteria bacterium RIFCSPLOWO2_01_FULL_40_39]OGZ74625.1 MAG: hypothetical protein A3I87_01670 [Candidatus Staskawiczbacteria bacterium RIFCSPLOWO2_02_FULL_39_8]